MAIKMAFLLTLVRNYGASVNHADYHQVDALLDYILKYKNEGCGSVYREGKIVVPHFNDVIVLGKHVEDMSLRCKKWETKDGKLSSIELELGTVDRKLSDLEEFVERIAKHYNPKGVTLPDPNHVDLRNNTYRSDLSKQEKQFRLTFERDYAENVNSQEYSSADAMLDYICKHEKVKSILHHGSLITVDSYEPILIHPDIFFQLKELSRSQAKITKIVFEIFSEQNNIQKLNRFVKDVQQNYEHEKNNQLGHSQQFFDLFVPSASALDSYFDQRANVGGTRNGGGGAKRTSGKAVDVLRFSRHDFVSNRKLDQLFFEKDKVVMERVRFFLQRKDWYDQKGMPWTLGILLHGPPGTGKTSYIKAIANESQRHIVNVNFGKIGSRKLIKKLFYDPYLEVVKGDVTSGNMTTESLYVPIEKRIYVLEDADCLLSDVLRDRASVPQVVEVPVTRGSCSVEQDYPSNQNDFMGMDSNIRPWAGFEQNTPKVEEDSLDLSTILNVLDGILETPGRILILTSNYPEKLDKALLRPGRIDIIAYLHNCTKRMIKGMFYNYFADDILGIDMEESEVDGLISRIEEYIWSPAEVTQVFLRNFEDRKKALVDLAENTPEEYIYGNVD